jgi:hypothetical protein
MMKKKKVHAEVEYQKNGEWVHSDLCPPECDFDRLTPEHRRILHECLDEWLDYSDGTGSFYIADMKSTDCF